MISFFPPRLFIHIYPNFYVICSTYIDLLRLEKKVCWWRLSYTQDVQQWNPIPPFCVWLWILLLLTAQPVYWDQTRATIFVIVNSVECWQRTCFSILWKQKYKDHIKRKGMLIWLIYYGSWFGYVKPSHIFWWIWIVKNGLIKSFEIDEPPRNLF